MCRVIFTSLFAFVMLALVSIAGADEDNCDLFGDFCDQGEVVDYYDGYFDDKGCRGLGRVCLDDDPRMVNGVEVTAECWEWKHTYECPRDDYVDTCDVYENLPEAPRDKFNEDAEGCAFFHSWCVETEVDGSCAKNRRQYVCRGKYKRIGDVGIEVYRPWGHLIEEERIGNDTSVEDGYVGTNHSPTKDQRDGGVYAEYIEFPKYWRNEGVHILSECNQSKRPDCNAVGGLVCAAGPATYNVGSDLDLTRDCWAWEQEYACLGDEIDENDCQELNDDPNCELVDNECIASDDDGNCLNRTYRFECGEGDTAIETEYCGSAEWCLDGSCEDIERPEASDGFGQAATSMNLLGEMVKDFDKDNLTVFGGKRINCSKAIWGLKNCCKIGGLLVSTGLANCSESEQELAVARRHGQAHYVSTYCASKSFFGSCRRRAQYWCKFSSRLGKILIQQGRKQLGIGWGNCDGFTLDQVEQIDWEKIDLSEALGDVHRRMSIPEKNAFKKRAKGLIEDFYDRNKPIGVEDIDNGDDDVDTADDVDSGDNDDLGDNDDVDSEGDDDDSS